MGDGSTSNGWASGQIVNNAALVFAPPSYQTFAGGISGSGGVTKDAAGTMQLSGPNTYYGDTQVLDGTLLVSNSAALQNSTLDNSYGGVLRFIGLTSATLGGLKGNQNLSLLDEPSDLYGITLNVGANNQSTTFSSRVKIT